MKDTQKKTLLKELAADESATINGGYYYSPCYYGGGYGGGYGYGYGYGSATAINQVTNVNVLIND
jgi:hypothetical protein